MNVEVKKATSIFPSHQNRPQGGTNMPSKQFEEKQIPEKLIEREKLKEVGKYEKGEKVEKDYKEKDSKEKENKDSKETEGKYEPDGKGHLIDKTHKDQGENQVTYPQFAAHSAGSPKIPEKYIVEKIPHKEKIEIKEYVHEGKHLKNEIKEIKIEIKEYKQEKAEYEGIPGGGYPGGPVEQRLTALESAVSQLLHFIPENLRPDLSQGALKQESDAAKPGAPKPADPNQKGKS
jgi:hypothetical protein